ncbi:class I SAM-dependent methyltransferase [Arhodomonas sp. AD133]|uniref:class I SAM-dependent methyltransferase n=1 Tax=Arhodomonas sp. AD133 TaxID=3415009 RepID=UPI003EBD3005
MPATMSSGYDQPRFRFGANWKNFVGKISEAHIHTAEVALADMLGRESLRGCRFLDVGCGSGLSSLAARRLGAEVVSFDYDDQSVECTRDLRGRYCGDDRQWSVTQGNVLDTSFMESLGTFDVVYSWGVLHHTGRMWEAIDATIDRVRVGGQLFIAIYNDQGPTSRRWAAVKRIYVSGPLGEVAVKALFLPAFAGKRALADVLHGRSPMRRYRDYRRNRGMSLWTDWIDWLGGYPFEVAKPEALFHHVREKGFTLTRLTTRGGGLGCNELVFARGVTVESPEQTSASNV